MYTFERSCAEKTQNKFKLLHPILIFKVIKEVCCAIILPRENNSSKKSLKDKVTRTFMTILSICKHLTTMHACPLRTTLHLASYSIVYVYFNF